MDFTICEHRLFDTRSFLIYRLIKHQKIYFFKETFEERGKVQNLMKHLGFQASQWKEPIEHMSMGERVKCKLMAYILDEKRCTHFRRTDESLGSTFT